ncbi:MAG: hypothetical protein ABSD48_15955 [Armatimonadota bacterium]
MMLDAYGSSTSTFAHNTISCGGAIGVQQAVDIRGRFNVIDNAFSDFGETGSTALSLHPDRLGQPLPNIISGNIFENCSRVVSEAQDGLWRTCKTFDNVFTRCGGTPEPPASGATST